VANALGRFGTIAFKATAHGLSQGFVSLCNGGNFYSGAVSGMLGSLAFAGWGKIGDVIGGKVNSQFFDKAIGGITFAAISGGAGAELAGGNFWKGAIQAAMVAGLNDVLHQAGNKIEQKTYEKMLEEKLKTVKIGESIESSELIKLKLLTSLEAKAFKSITRVSETKFIIERTIAGGILGISKDAYFEIKTNATLGTYSGIEIISHGLPNNYATLPSGQKVVIPSFVLSGNNCYFQYKSHIYSFSIK
jgi:hypothetical protein